MTTATGYQPPAVDLTPFRAGTVWHYRDLAYLVVDMAPHEKVSQRVIRHITGRPVEGKIRSDGAMTVSLTLERADWLDTLPVVRRWDDCDEYGKTLRVDGGTWIVGGFRPVIITPSPVLALVAKESATVLEVELWHDPGERVWERHGPAQDPGRGHDSGERIWEERLRGLGLPDWYVQRTLAYREDAL